MISSWWKKLQYPFWYAQAIGGVLLLVAKEYHRANKAKKYRVMEDPDVIGYWLEVDDERDYH